MIIHNFICCFSLCAEMGQHKEMKALLFLGLICMSTVMPALAAPNNARKFAVKSNSPKKVYHKHKDIDRSDQIQQNVAMVKIKIIRQLKFFVFKTLRLPSFKNKQSDALGAPPSNEMMMSGPSPSPANILWSIAAPLVQLLKVFLAGPNDFDGNGLTPGEDKMDGPVRSSIAFESGWM